MPGKSDLLHLKNIGKKLAARLNEAGILSEADLREVGAVGAHRRIKALYPEETLPVCYYLYSFEGALRGQHWDDIGALRKKALEQALKDSQK